MNIKWLLAGIAVAVAATTLGLAAGRWMHGGDVTAETTLASNRSVDLLWAAPLTDINGKTHTLAGLQGQAAVVNFWASWCSPCVEEIPELAKFSRQYATKGIRFVGIGIDSAQNIREFMHKVEINYPIYISGFGGADLMRNFGNSAGGLPFTVVIDAHGNVRHTQLGQIQPAKLKQVLDTL